MDSESSLTVGIPEKKIIHTKKSFNEFYKTNFKIKNEQFISNLIKYILKLEKVLLGNINLLFCTDKYLLILNKKDFKKSFYTDVITFTKVENFMIYGDIFISIERVLENYIKWRSTFNLELNRIIIHSLLHLLGYNEKIIYEKKLLLKKEEYYIGICFQIFMILL